MIGAKRQSAIIPIMDAARKTTMSVGARRTVDLRFVELTDKVRKNRPGDDIDLLRRAYDFAAEQHKTQFRLSGEPYLSHPLEVAHLLADMKLDVTSICAALLHDVVEDTKIPLEKISESFGPDVARLVEGVTKISQLDLLAPEDRQAENVRKMLLAMVNDVRVVMVKLGDRLHNMRTLEFLAPERQQRIARETLDIYAPVANRLGMGLIRGELEDLAFRYLEPEAFLELQKKVASKQKVFDKFLREVQDAIRSKMVENGIPAEVQGRVKRLLFAPPEDPEAAAHSRSGVRSAGDPRGHRHGEELLRRARRDPSDLAAGAGPLQGLHRDAAAESLPVAAHDRDSFRPAVRGADSHAGDAPHRRAGRGGALEIQGWRPRGAAMLPRTISASSGCAT